MNTEVLMNTDILKNTLIFLGSFIIIILIGWYLCFIILKLIMKSTRIKTLMFGYGLRNKCPKCDNELEQYGINKYYRCTKCNWGETDKEKEEREKNDIQ